MARKAIPLNMSRNQRQLLETWVRAKTIPQRVFFRARICLLAADGLPNTVIAQELHTCRPTVLLWRRRFEKHGPEGLTKDAPRGPSPKKIAYEKVRAIMHATLYTDPPHGDRWTTRTLAEAHGVSNATVARIWKAHGYKPQRKRPAHVSQDSAPKVRSGLMSLLRDMPRGRTSKKSMSHEFATKKRTN
jgi:transposase